MKNKVLFFSASAFNFFKECLEFLNILFCYEIDPVDENPFYIVIRERISQMNPKSSSWSSGGYSDTFTNLIRCERSYMSFVLSSMNTTVPFASGTSCWLCRQAFRFAGPFDRILLYHLPCLPLFVLVNKRPDFHRPVICDVFQLSLSPEPSFSMSRSTTSILEIDTSYATLVTTSPDSYFFWYSLLCILPQIFMLSPTVSFSENLAFLPHAMHGM